MTDTAPPPEEPRFGALVAAMTGTVLWAAAVLVPAHYLGLLGHLRGAERVAVWLPGAAIASVALFAAHRPAALILGAPVMCLPALVLLPEFTGPRVYGPMAFIVLVGLTGLHVLLSLPRTPGLTWSLRRRAGPPMWRPGVLGRVVGALALVFALTVYATIFNIPVRAAVARSFPGAEALATSAHLAFLVGAWLLVIPFRFRQLTRALRSPPRRNELRVELEMTDPGRVRGSLVFALVLALLSGVALAALLVERARG